MLGENQKIPFSRGRIKSTQIDNPQNESEYPLSMKSSCDYIYSFRKTGLLKKLRDHCWNFKFKNKFIEGKCINTPKMKSILVTPPKDSKKICEFCTRRKSCVALYRSKTKNVPKYSKKRNGVEDGDLSSDCGTIKDALKEIETGKLVPVYDKYCSVKVFTAKKNILEEKFNTGKQAIMGNVSKVKSAVKTLKKLALE